MKFPLSVLALILVCMRAAGDTTVAVGDMSGFATTMGSGVTTYSLTSDVTYSFSEETPYRLPAPASSGRSWIITSADTEDTKSLTLSGGDYLASVNKGGSGTKFIITNLENFSVSGYNGGYSAFSSTWGGIFYSDSQRQEVHLKGNSGAITFSENKVEKEMTGEKPQYTHIRSAVLNIDGFNSKLLIEDNGGVVTFENNIINFSSGASGYTGTITSQVFGAAINLRSGTMSLSSNTGGVVFKGNRVENATGTVEGGAVILVGTGTIAMNDNAGGVSFQGNSARSTWSYMAADSTTTNTTSYYVGGGAVSAYNTNSFIEISGNSPMQGSAAAVSFSGNVLEAAGTSTSVRGGAIIASNLSISGNHGGVEFLNNHASSLFEGVTEAPIHVCGGAIYMGFSNTASICNNEGPITIQGNWAAASSTTDVVVRGGFFSGTSDSIVNLASLEISGNQGDIDISGNYVRAMRAATAEVNMTDSAALGGAIFASNLTLKNNTGNVTFRKNYEVTTNRTILRSVVASTLDISADAGKSITFYDSVYSSGVASFNAFGNGSVIFTGETTQADLREVKGGTTIRDAEIAASRTSVFKGMVDVQGGKLEVRSGAVLQGVGMSVAGDAAVSLQEGSITHTGEAAFESGSMLEVVGVGNVLTASTLEFAGGSTLKFVYGEGLAENAALTFTGTLSLAESAVIQLSGFAGHTSTAQQLISMQNSTLQGWNTGTLTFVDETGAALDASRFVWENDVLYYKTGQTILTWSNGTGDGKWNNISANWTTGDTSISSTEHADIIFGSNENTRETITLEGELTVRNMTVQQGGNYAYTASTAGTSLSLESLTVESGATADIQLGSGALNANEISGAGTVTISGGTLNMNSLAVSAGTTTLDGPLSVAADSTLVVTGGGILKATDSASIDVQGTLDLSQFTYKITDGNSNKGIITVFNAISGPGTVLLKSGAEIQTETDRTAVNLAANYKVAGTAANASLALTSWAKQNKTWRTWTVGTGGSLTIGDAGDGTLSMLTGQQLQVVDGGELKVGTLNLGYNDINGNANNPGSLLMSGDASKVTLNHIHIQNGTENWLNDITITGGTLKVTGTEAVTYATGTNIARTNITIGGTEGQTVTLQTGDNDWTLTRQSDAASTLTVGDVTIDAANTGTITLAGATLTGTITNNARLALGGGVTVAEGTQASIDGSMVQLDATLTSAGTLNLNTDAIYLGSTLKDVITTGGTVSYSLGGENGFQSIGGMNYYLSTNGNVIVQKATTATLHGIVYALQTDTSGGQYNGGKYIAVGDTVTASDFYISSGTVTVDSAVHEAASRYYLRGGTMLIDKNLSVNNSIIDYTEGDAATIQLSDGASLVLDSGANGLNVTNLLSGKLSALPAAEGATPTGRLIISSDATLANGFASTFTGAVELQDTKLTVGAGPSEEVNVSSISDFILNGTSEIYYHADPTQDVDIRKITVQSGAGSLKLNDSENSPMMVNEVAVESGAVFKFWSQWHDSALTIETLSGGGKFLAESADANSKNPLTTINSLTGFTGDLEFVKDTAQVMTVLVQTGTGEALSFNSLTATNLNGAMNFTFNVQRNTTVQTLTAAAGTVSLFTGTTLTLGDGVNASTHSIGTLNAAAGSTIHLNADATLHAFTKASGGSAVKLDGSGTLDLGDATKFYDSTSDGNQAINGNDAYFSLADNWSGTVSIQNAVHQDKKLNLNLGEISNARSSVALTNVKGWFIGEIEGKLILNTDAAGNAAWTICNGQSNVESMVTLGSIDGAGSIYHGWSTNYKTGITITGDVSTWTGSFMMDTANENTIFNLLFNDAATTVNARIGGTAGNTARLHLKTGSQTVTFNETVDAYALTTGGDVIFANDVTVQSDATLTGTLQVQKGTMSIGGSLSASAQTVSVAAGTTLTLGDGVNASTHSIGTLNAAGNSTIHLNADATLHAFSKSGNGTLTLTGSGIYDLGTLEIGQASATITDKVTMGTGTSDAAQWKGTVKISGGEYNTSWRDNTSQSIQNINFNNLGQAGSTVEIAEGNLYGYIQNVDADYAADIRLTGSFYIQNSYTRESSYSAFSGSIIADEDGGHIYITRTNDRQNQYEFKGDVSGWKTSLTQNTTNNGVTNEIIFSADAHTINAAIINENAGVLNLQIATAEDATLSKNVDVTKLEVSNTARLVGESNSITAGNVEISQKDATLSNVTVEGSSICAADTTGDAKGSISNSLVRLQDETAFTIENMVLTNTTLAAASSATAVKLKNVEGSTARLTMGAFTLDATPQVDAQADGGKRGSLSYTNGLAVSGNSDATLTLNLDVLGAVEEYGTGTYDLTITLSGYGSDFVLPENISSLVSFDTTSWLYEALVSQNANFGGATAAVRTLAALETAGVPTVQYTAGTGDNVGRLVITISGLNVPEPTTSTLGLLALGALAARRRRK